MIDADLQLELVASITMLRPIYKNDLDLFKAVMREIKGRANPATVAALIKETR